MSNFLEENQVSEIRFEADNGKIVLYNPNEEQKKVLKEIISKNTKIDEEGNIKSSIEVRFIREIFRELVKDGNFIDKYTDEELLDKLNKGNRKIKLLYREIEDLMYELSEEVINDNINQVEYLNQLIGILQNTDSVTKMQSKLQKLLKKKNVKLSFEELSKDKNKVKELTKTLNEFNNK